MTPPLACWWFWVCGARETLVFCQQPSSGLREGVMAQWEVFAVAARAGAGCSAFITIKNSDICGSSLLILWLANSTALKPSASHGVIWKKQGVSPYPPTKTPQICPSGAGGSLYLNIIGFNQCWCTAAVVAFGVGAKQKIKGQILLSRGCGRMPLPGTCRFVQFLRWELACRMLWGERLVDMRIQVFWTCWNSPYCGS